MQAEFLAPLADAGDFPAPDIPLRPHLSWRLLRGDRMPVAAGDGEQLTVSGRVALAAVASDLALGPEDRVLLPAYHCPSLVEPFVACGAQVDYYPVDAGLEPRVDELMSRLRDATRAVVFVRYFGLDPAHLDALADALRARGVAIVHDCAHAYYALPRVPATDYAVASLVKFFALEEGGVVRFPAARPPPDYRPGRAPRGADARLALAALERARAAGALAPLAWLSDLADLRSRWRRRVPTAPAQDTPGAREYRYFDPAAVGRSVTWSTARLLGLVGRRTFPARRRELYARLAEATASGLAAHPLAPRLGAHDVPYVFPLVLHHPRRQFAALRNSGIPLYRWEEIVPTDCAVSAEYRESLVQVPCHQDLSDAHLARLVTRLRQTLA